MSEEEIKRTIKSCCTIKVERGLYEMAQHDLIRLTTKLTTSFDRLKAENRQLVEALKTISEWKLPETGEKWPSGEPMTFGSLYGSNGERDYMRKIALTAIESLSK